MAIDFKTLAKVTKLRQIWSHWSRLTGWLAGGLLNNDVTNLTLNSFQIPQGPTLTR